MIVQRGRQVRSASSLFEHYSPGGPILHRSTPVHKYSPVSPDQKWSGDRQLLFVSILPCPSSFHCFVFHFKSECIIFHLFHHRQQAIRTCLCEVLGHSYLLNKP